MVNLPAVCNKCGSIFPSGVAANGGVTITIMSSKSGPCPVCGGMGDIPDGTYRVIENIIEVLSAPDRTIYELKRLSEILDQAKKEEISKKELVEEAEKTIPKISSLLEWVIPKTREEKFEYGSRFIMAILGIATQLFISTMINNQPVEEIRPETIINQTYEIQNYNVYEKKPVKVEKAGRNDPCPCGSGAKYKMCHGK